MRYISSVCIQFKEDIDIKVYVFGLSKGWCVFFCYFGTVCYNHLFVNF